MSHKIECGEIDQYIDALTMKMHTCQAPSNRDILDLLDIIKAVRDCSGGGDYDTLVSATYEGPLEVYFPVRSLHSFSLNVLKGSITYEDTDFSAGSSRNAEFSTTNAVEIKFFVNAGSEVFFQYLK